MSVLTVAVRKKIMHVNWEYLQIRKVQYMFKRKTLATGNYVSIRKVPINLENKCLLERTEG
jgi:hypothetical protein